MRHSDASEGWENDAMENNGMENDGLKNNGMAICPPYSSRLTITIQ
jgi:hypothetical protein